jgi:DNA-binding NtrC family response regulator
MPQPVQRILLCDLRPDGPELAPLLAGLGQPELLRESELSRAAERLRQEPIDLVVAAVAGGPADVPTLETLRAADRSVPLLVVATEPGVALATGALRCGAGNLLTQAEAQPGLAAAALELLAAQRRGAEYELLRRQVERPYSFDDMIGGCAAMRRVFDLIAQVAQSDVDVLVLGETGTGKELVARSIHCRSRRQAGPFVPVDCGAIPESLLESEFFGHEKGAFTGADSRRIGLVEFANQGTFFLDELGELPLLLQAKLLRVLQERKIRRVGGREELPVDLRIVAATARPLDELARGGQFRQDLLYRINVVQIELPPLRERGDDIGLLAEHLLYRHGREMGREVRGLTPEAYQVLAQYRWPGNVRELQNVVRRGLALARGPMLGVDDLPDELVSSAGQGRREAQSGFFPAREEHVAQFEQHYLRELLARHQGDVRAAAREAVLPRGTLYRLMKKHGLAGDEFR